MKKEFSQYGYICPYFEQQLSDKEKNVDNNYSIIYKNIDEMSSMKTAVEYLKGLGFDVSWIYQNNSSSDSLRIVDTSILFPCGENK